MDATIGSLTTSLPRERRGADFSAPIAAVATVPAEPARPAEIRVDSQRSIERDAATGSLVYRLTDVSTGFVTVQTPSEARLKLRAYIDGVTALHPNEPAVEVTA